MKLMSKSDSKEMAVGRHNQSNWMDFHMELVEFRIAQGLTQTEVAERLGISQPAVSQFEKLNSYPMVESVLDYAMAIGAKLSFKLENDAK